MQCSATRQVSQADLNAGSVTNTATVRSDWPNGNPDSTDDDLVATDSDVVTANRIPSINLTKSVDSGTYGAASDLLTYTFIVDNPGNVTLSSVRLSDTLANLSAISCPDVTLPTTLDPGDQFTCTATRVIGQAAMDTGTISNNATTTGTGPGGQQVSDTDAAVSTVIADPSVSIDKVASPTIVNLINQTVTYTFTVTNTGNQSLTNPRVTDNKPDMSAVTCTPAMSPTLTLAPGATMTCSATRSVTQEQ